MVRNVDEKRKSRQCRGTFESTGRAGRCRGHRAHHTPGQASGSDHGRQNGAQANQPRSASRADRHDADAAGVRPRLRSAIAGPGPLLTLYLDTSLLVAALTNETETGRMQAWLGEQEPSRLAVSEWVITEFSAALSMKLRRGQIEASHRADALAMFTRLSGESFTILLVSGL